MSISKEIFGINRKTIADSDSVYGENIGFNEALDLLDQYELSEEALAKVIKDNLKQALEGLSGYNWGLTDKAIDILSKAIKSKQSKLFVRKSK